MTNDGIVKGVVVRRKNIYGYLFNTFLVESTCGDNIKAKDTLGKKTILERNDFYPVKVPSLRISKEDMDKIKAGVRILNHNITKSWIDVVERFKDTNFKVIMLTHANRRVYVLLDSINRSIKRKIIKESANGILTKEILSVRYVIHNTLFE